MEQELNYISEKIESLESRMSLYEDAPNLDKSPGLQHVLKCRQEELVILNSILSTLTELTLDKSLRGVTVSTEENKKFPECSCENPGYSTEYDFCTKCKLKFKEK